MRAGEGYLPFQQCVCCVCVTLVCLTFRGSFCFRLGVVNLKPLSPVSLSLEILGATLAVGGVFAFRSFVVAR
jgi:hypothetical protein